MRDLVLVKLGGSLITDKRRRAAARRSVMSRLATEIAMALPEMTEGLVLGHGSGSFGHVAAARYGLGEGLAPHGEPRAPLTAVSHVQNQAARLHRLLCDALEEAGVASCSWAPSSTMLARAGRPVAAEIGPLAAALELGLVPVVYGDVVLDHAWGASICSTEAVLGALITRLKRRGVRRFRMLWMGETDGVLDRHGETIPRVDRRGYARVLKMVDHPAGTDVTGGMLLRLETVRALARRGIESWLVNGLRPGLLGAALRGRQVPGTHIVADA